MIGLYPQQAAERNQNCHSQGIRSRMPEESQLQLFELLNILMPFSSHSKSLFRLTFSATC